MRTLKFSENLNFDRIKILQNLGKLKFGESWKFGKNRNFGKNEILGKLTFQENLKFGKIEILE